MLQAHAYFIGHFMYVLSDNHVTIGWGTKLETIKNSKKENHNKKHILVLSYKYSWPNPNNYTVKGVILIKGIFHEIRVIALPYYSKENKVGSTAVLKKTYYIII